jgi:hypothetical protein
MLDEHYSEMLKTEVMNEKELQWILKPVNIYPIKETSDVSNIVKIAIALSNDRPFKVVILTSPETRTVYTSSPHMANVTDVLVSGGEDAVSFINKMFREEYEAIRR